MQAAWTAGEQTKRRSEVYALYLEKMRDVMDRNGNPAPGRPRLNLREAMWHTLPLLEEGGGSAELANGILLSLELIKCHFSPMIAMQILLKYERLLQRETVQKLENYARGSLASASSEAIHFTMYNDNFAAMAVFLLLAAGERFDDQSAFDAGARKLRQLRDVLTRCGTLMEYGSPVYTPITTHVLAEMVNYVQNEEIRSLAAECETRMWAEMATRFHPPTALFAGPYSRAYWADSVGHINNIGGFLYYAIGEAVFINPVKDLFPPKDGQVIHVGLETLVLPNLVWLCSGLCHCPDELAERMLHKAFPFQAITTTECLPGKEYVYKEEAAEFPAWTGPNVTYMTEDFAMGTSCAQFFDGAITDGFHVVYRKTVPARRQEDTGVVLCRYIFNERKPENTNVYNGNVHGPEMFRDEGRKFGLQQKDCSLLVYQPKPYEAKRTTSMKLSILLPCHFGEPEEIRLGAERRVQGAAESRNALPVYIKDGPVYFAFRPLQLTDHGRQAAVKVTREGQYLSLSFYNYEGEERGFETREAILTTNGFIAHVKRAEEFADFDAFIRYAEQGTLEDELTGQLEGYTRRIRYTHPEADLQFAYSPVSEGILYSTVNGLPRRAPRFEATGFDANALPFLGNGRRAE
ncbi:hypothetical protein [Paenibacillus koleovorans]|uniref:hypothetical protein n=1 Tax=Paenibacillus koleovorans TaxID=121608 RepID=UPI000FD9251C|nr:hypothetical protein [Paenibacillus koleovorans]